MLVQILQVDLALPSSMESAFLARCHDLEISSSVAQLISSSSVKVSSALLVLTDGREDFIATVQQICEALPEKAILVLCGCREISRCTAFLNAGADDALGIDSCPAEVHARMVAIVCRKMGFSPPVVKFFGVELNLISRTAQFNEIALPLSENEFQFLEQLVLRSIAAGVSSEAVADFCYSSLALAKRREEPSCQSPTTQLKIGREIHHLKCRP